MKKNPGQQFKEDFDVRYAEMVKIARREAEIYAESLHLDEMSAEEKILKLYHEKELVEKELKAHLKSMGLNFNPF